MIRRRTLRRRRFPLILLYHRVEELSTDPLGMAVRPDHFAEHLAVLRSHFSPVSLSRAAEKTRKGNADRHIAITFDDGYADNLLNAKPLLAHYGVPATFFVTSDYVDSDREFWWDDLERILLAPGRLPEVLELEIGRETWVWRLEREACETHSALTHRTWTLSDEGDPTSRHTLYRTLLPLLREQPDSARRVTLEQLRSATNMTSETRDTHRPLTSTELRELEEGGLAEIGAHTRTHPVLASLPVEEQREEIAGSRQRLTELTGISPTVFAYPYGWHGHYTQATAELVRKLGFEWACSGFPPALARSRSHFELPRLAVNDCDGETFARDVLRLA